MIVGRGVASRVIGQGIYHLQITREVMRQSTNLVAILTPINTAAHASRCG